MQTFYSNLANKKYKGPSMYHGMQFHFHHGSEHTINGKRHDLEMHTVHRPVGGEQGGVQYAAMGILFSVNDATIELTSDQQKIIDDFFSSLKWEDKGSKEVIVEEIPYGDLMMLIDTNDRWIYKGSVTTPPCTAFVYWNVLRTVYPISE